MTAHLEALLSRADAPYAADPPLASRLRSLFAAFEGRPLERAALAALLHRAADRRLPPGPILSVLSRAATAAPPETFPLLLETLDDEIVSPREAALFLRGLARLIDRDPPGLAPWLLLARRARLLGLPLSTVVEIYSGYAEGCAVWHPGDAAARLLHLAAALPEAGIPAGDFLAACAAFGRAAAGLPRFTSALFALFAPPALPFDPTLPAPRRLGTGEVAAAPGERLAALPISLTDGILPPGCLRWHAADGALLGAGYSIAAVPGELLLVAESFDGSTATRIARVAFADPPPPEAPGFYDERYSGPAGARLDPLRFLTGYASGCATPPSSAAARHPAPPPDPAALAAAGAAYAASQRWDRLASALGDRIPPAPPPVSSAPVRVIIY